ncbi:MAG: LPS-assembly protein LptD, partial [Amphiplicatus sp.]
ALKRLRLVAHLLATSAIAGARAEVPPDDAPPIVVERATPTQAILIGAAPPPLRPGAALIASLAPDAAPAARPVLREGPRIDPPDGKGDSEVLFEADHVYRQDEASPIIAEGDVNAYAQGQHLKADRLSYDPATEIIVAEGHVSLSSEGVDAVFADRVEITGDMRDGIAENVSAILEENARMAGETAIREQGARTTIRRAVYTACNVCNKDGDPKTPTWSVRAARVTRDEERKVVRFRNAFFRIKGVPILYAPFLQAPDPSIERQSGFLTPVIGASERLGFNFELPYYLALSNHQDATFYPKYTSNDGVLWQGEYRRRDQSGDHVWQGGFINFGQSGSAEEAAGVDVPNLRWHFFGRGHRNFGDKWRIGYDVERVSDDIYLRRYDVKRRGDLQQEIDTSQTNRLRSNVYMRWKSGGSELTVDTYAFQGLRLTDDSALTPYVLPLINFRHDFGAKILGGRAQINANFATLLRSGGADSQRLTASAYWEREYFTQNGHRFNFFGELRADGYYFRDLNLGTEIQPGIPGADNDFEWRWAPTAGAEWSYPLTRRLAGARLFVEPRAQLIASPTNRNSSSIINEDSQSIEFDYAGLFDYNKATGFDAFEDGQRANIGVTASAIFDSGLTVAASIGEQFRLQTTAAFDPSTGLGEKRSDIVGALNIRYKNVVGVENRFRIDDNEGSLKRVESFAFLNFWRVSSNVSYVRLNEENALAELSQREEITGSMRLSLTNHIHTGLGWRENLSAGRTISQDFTIGYSDECATIDLTYQRNFTRDVGLDPDTAIFLRFTLRTLVDQGTSTSF